jgi:hypothetical protein
MNELSIFRDNYREYVFGLDFSLGDVFNFGDMIYDYSLSFVGGEFNLFIYDVVLDHYGMPMRDVLSERLFIFVDF